MPEPKVTREINMCCGYKKCPRLVFHEDGTLVVHDDDDERGPQRIEFRPELVDELRRALGGSTP